MTKGVYFGMRMVKSLPSAPALVFISDGHEAPPLNPRLALQIESEAGEVKGFIVGAGGSALSPIPKHDMTGNSLGYWEADEVLQTDRSSLGRGSSQAGERMVLDEDAPEQVRRN
ncbi:MAG TPA: hypothetical protein VLA73_10940 [Burkholderiales bacterium]|nr:hypothetical protein [Burkholderiales bacterium]